MSTFDDQVKQLFAKHEALITRKNEPVAEGNGVYTRYKYPVVTAAHTPIFWRYDLDEKTNPYLMERIGMNAAMNSGAIKWNGKYILVVRVEGCCDCTYQRFEDLGTFAGFEIEKSAAKCGASSGIRGWKICVLYPSTGWIHRCR